MRRRIEADPDRFVYTDQALAPVTDYEAESFELFTQNQAARNAVEKARKIAQLTAVADTV